ncbi:MAG: YhcH/YjgK/YiaL family protein [Clostridia bacterium]|nr:YhcH/YjgK/YiaL family protein [Clostridia bacterium]
MIIDNIKNAANYYGLGAGFEAALKFLATYSDTATEKADLPVCDGVMVKCRPYMTKDAADCTFEAHEKYADIHFVVSGCECIGYAPIDTLTVTDKNEEKDMIYLDGEGTNIPLRAGDFMITLPQDAHMPCVKLGDESVFCAKLVAKIKL